MPDTTRPGPDDPRRAGSDAGSAPRATRGAKPTRLPAYRRRMMIALTLVIVAGFVLGVLLPAS